MLEDTFMPLARGLALLVGLACIAFLAVIAVIEMKTSRLTRAADARSAFKERADWDARMALIAWLGREREKERERDARDL